MKNRNCLCIMLLLNVISSSTIAQDAKAHLRDFTPKLIISTFKVYGKCGMCTLRILNALEVNGIESPYWQKESQMLTVQYDSNKITLNRMYLLLANVGHDTEKIKAESTYYEALPICCHYRESNQLHNQ
jgi:periplasmic mercuric ion binding protein